MKVAVSACLIGHNCKYDGKNNLNQKLMEFLSDKDVIPLCPEMMGGLKAPRPSCEIVNGRVINTEGQDVTEAFESGAALALNLILMEKPDVIILQSRSPSCGVKQIYDGSFSGNKIPGQGKFAKLCLESGIKTIDVEDLESFCTELQSK